MTGPAGADLLVRRVRGVATGIADGRRHDAGELPEVLLVAPEAAEAEDRGLRAVGPRAGERGAEDPVDARLHDRLGSSGEGVSGGGDGVGLGVKNLMPESIGTLDDESMTSARAGSPGCRRARPRAGCPRPPSSATKRRWIVVPAKASSETERRPPRAVDVDRLAGDLGHDDLRAVGAFDDRAQACRPTSTWRCGRRRSAKVRRWPETRRQTSIAWRSDRSSAHRGRWTRPRRPRPRPVTNALAPDADRSELLRAGARRRRRVRPGEARVGRRRVGAIGVAGPAAGDLEVVVEGAAAGDADRGPQDGQRTGGPFHQVQRPLPCSARSRTRSSSRRGSP